jgi:hypothetical protein
MIARNPDHDPAPQDDGTFKDDGSLYLHSACHIDYPTWSALHPVTGVLTILCAKCQKVVTRLQVVKKGGTP